MVEGLETPCQCVDTQVEQSAAGEIGVDHSVQVVGEGGLGGQAHGEVGGDAVDCAEAAGGDEVADVDGQGKVARPDCLHEKEVLWGKGVSDSLFTPYELDLGTQGALQTYLLFRFLDQQFRLRGIHSKRLLAQHILSRLQTQHGILEMVRVRGSNVHNIDIGIIHEVIVGAIRFCRRGGTDVFEELLSAGLARGAGGGDNGVDDGIDAAGLGVDEEIFGEGLGDAPGGEDAPADGGGFSRHGKWRVGW